MARWGSNWGPFIGRQMEGVPNALPTGLSKRGNARARPENEAAKNGFRVEGGDKIGTRRIWVKGRRARKGWKGGLTTTSSRRTKEAPGSNPGGAIFPLKLGGA